MTGLMTKRKALLSGVDPVCAPGGDLNRRVVVWGLAGATATVAGSAHPQAGPRSQGPERGALLIIGGGDRGREIQHAAWSLAGGREAQWVYIPTAFHDDDLGSALPPTFARHARRRVQVLHTRDRSEADTAAFAAPLQNATAVFIDGGRQWRLTDAYLDTRTHAALRGVLDRGGVVVGTSAGAAVLASYLMRGSPEGSDTVMSPGHEVGFGFLTHAAIDPHVVKWRRERDMAQVVVAHPDVLGIGLDEGAAVVVRNGDMLRVNGRAVLITDGVDHDGEPFLCLAKNRSFDLTNWRPR